MLKEENKIFKNLYNNYGWEIDKALDRDDWKNTNELLSKAKNGLLTKLKLQS